MFTKMPFDQYYLNIAREVARRSNCIKRQIGAIIVVDNSIVSTGYNGTPRGVPDCCDGGCARCANKEIQSGTNLDICWCSHSEENCITRAAYHGIKTNGGIMYTTLSPCVTCAKLIINAGIKTVKYWGEYPQDSAELLNLGKVSLQSLKVE
jgi:dCMP deaminase